MASAARRAAIDAGRLWQDLMALAAITEPERPYTRRSFSPLFDAGRLAIRGWLLQAGLEVTVDFAGNLIGRLPGRDPARGTIAIGSHSDTVPGGGRFDGIAGVAAAIEIARAFASSGERLHHDLAVIDFLAEEPSDFGLSCIGSRGMTGMLEPAMLALADRSGRRLSEALIGVGGDPLRLEAARRSDIAAFFELHIEQGPVLEDEGLDLGLVTGIVGIRRIEVRFTGQAAHAGTAPMHLRRDAAYAGALLIAAVREEAERLAAAGEGYFVATVGIVEVRPGGSNVVPRECRLVIDARSSDPALANAFAGAIEAASHAVAARAGVERSAFETLSDGLPALCDPGLRGYLRASADRLGFSAREMASGAGHDAAFMARICPSAMLFIPCLKGMSHTPDEWAEPDALAKGAAVLLEAVRSFDAAAAG